MIARRFVISLGIVAACATTARAETQIAVNGATAAATVTAGTATAVSISGGPANATDWVGLYRTGAPNGAYLDWRYLNGSTAAPATGFANATVTLPALVPPGDYEFRLFAKNGFGRLGTSARVTVVASPAHVTVNGTSPPTAVAVGVGSHVTVSVNSGPANASDWVGLYAANSPDSRYLTWRYLNGTTTVPAAGLSTANLDFAVPASAGSYEFRLFAANGFVRLATSTAIVVASSPAALAVNGVSAPGAVSVTAGSDAVVSVSAGPANATDWVGLYVQGSGDGAYVDWRYLSGTTLAPATGVVAATLHFAMPTMVGTYEFRFFADNAFGRLTTSGAVTVTPSPARISVNGILPPADVVVRPGATATVQVTGGPANTTDWIALAARGSANRSYLAWKYLNGVTTPPTQGVSGATLSFNVPTGSGNYEFRLFANDGFQRLATSGNVIARRKNPTPPTVTSITPTPGATDVGLASNMTATFSEELAASSVTSSTFQLRNPSNTLIPASVTYQASSHVATLDPAASLAESTLYTARLEGGTSGITDLEGTALATDYSWSFTTAAVTPNVTTTFPLSSAADVIPGASILATFLVPLDPSTVTSSTFELWDGSNTLVAASVAYQSTTRTAVLIPAYPLFELSSYTVILKTGIASTAGVHLQNDYSWAFTTTDVTAPTVIETLPAPDASNADVSHAIVVVFSEPMAIASMTLAAFELRDPTNALVPLSVAYDAETNTATLVPAVPLTHGATYTAVAKGGSSPGAKDLAGNALAADYGWSFSTQSAGCSYTVSPTSISAPSEGSPGTIDVSTSWGCQASLASDAPWLSVTPIGYAARILGEHPAGYWRLDDPVNASAQDSSGHHLDAYSDTAIHRVPTPWADGNHAAAFDGTGYIDLSSDPSLDSQTSFTLEAWVRVTQPTTGSIASNYWLGSGYALEVNGTHAVFHADSSSAPLFSVQSANALNDDAWHHVVGAYDASGGTARLFIDGALDGSSTTAGSPRAGGDLLIGASDYGLSNVITASIDEVAYFGVALTADQVAAHFTARGNAVPPTTGTLDDTVTYTIVANPTGLVRNGHLTVGNSVITVTQAGLPCTYTVSPQAASVDAPGSPVTISVDDPIGCPWSATTDTSWISVDRVTDGYAGQILHHGPAGYWRLDDTGSTVRDSSGHGADAVIEGSYSQGVMGATADGNAATRLGGGLMWFPVERFLGSRFSIEGWIRSDDGGGGTIARSSEWRLAFDNARLQFYASQGETVLADLQTEPVPQDGAWHHVVATFDSDQRTVQLFVDGTLSVSATSSGGINASSNAFPTVGYLNAALDELAVYSSILTPAQVARHFAQRVSSGGGTGVVTYAVSPNASIVPRAGQVHVAGVAASISQAGRPCFDMAPAAISVDAAGATGTIHLTALDSGCTWTGAGSAAWIALDSQSGTGSGDTHYTIAVNTTPINRTATILIGGRTIAVAQSGAPLQRPGFNYSVAGGQEFALALRNDGVVWAWGRNNQAQLGDGSTINRPLPIQIPTLSNVVALAAGDAHSLALTNTGAVWAWGANGLGQLGQGSFAFTLVPKQVSGLANVTAIAAGSSHSVALTAGGIVWTWGSNALGELGDGSTTNRTAPVVVTGWTGLAVAISAAGSHSLVVDATGAVWTFGIGQTHASRVSIAAPIVTAVATATGGFANAVDGGVWAWGTNQRGELGDGVATSSPQDPEQPATLAGLSHIAPGESHALALTANGRVRAWGGNESGQLGDGTAPCATPGCSLNQYSATPLELNSPTGVVDVAAHRNHNVAATADGQVWSWGTNGSNELGDGSTLQSSIPVNIADAGFVWHTGAPILTAGGTFTFPVLVRASSGTAGATIHYTLNGAEPTESDPVMPASPSGITIDQTTTVFARAWASSKPPSRIVSATYTLQVSPPAFSPGAGIYTSARTVSLATTVVGATIRYTTDGTAPTSASPAYSSPFVISTGTIVKAIAFKTGWTSSTLASATYVFNYGTLVTPVIAPVPGIYTYGQSVTMIAAANAVIRYTTNGATPTSASPAYMGPLTLSGPMTVKAAAFNPDWTTSAVATAAYGAKTASPTLAPDGGAYAAGQQITITDTTPNADIHYTTNGQEPTVSDLVVSNGGSISVGNFTLKARAFRTDLIASDTTTAEYSRLGDDCRFTVTPAVVNVGPTPTGGVLSLTSTGSSCSWTATPDVSWITVSPTAGTGTVGEIVYYLPANMTTSLRTGLIAIGDTAVLIVQGATPTCTFNVTPGAIAASAAAANGDIAITASDAGCGWTATSDASWISIATTDASVYARMVMADHPAGYWRLNEPANSTVVADTSGSGHAGTVSGGVTLGQSGPLADGSTTAAFDGATGAVQVADAAAFDRPAITWETWVKIPSVSAMPRQIFGKGATNEAFSLWIEPNDTRATLYFTSALRGRQSTRLPSTIVGAGWVHLAFAYDASFWHAYVNGVEDQSGATNDTLVTNSSAIVLGRDDTAQAWFDGQLADVALYPYALSAEQVANHFSQRSFLDSGGGHLQYAFAANATGAARAGTLTIAGATVPVAQAPSGGIVITGGTTSFVLRDGWHTGDATVSFACAGAGVISCPSAVTIAAEGEYDVPGQATNDLGSTASISVHVKVDKTAPFVSVGSPSLGALVDPGALTMSGTAIDLLSGLTAITCNDLPATVTDNTFSCDATVPSGTSSVTVRAFDLASNVHTTTVSVTTEDSISSSPASLRITPEHVTILAGEMRDFTVMDNLFRVPSHAAWTIDNATIATLSTTPTTTLTGVSAGDVTLTATWQGLTATTHVTVLAVSSAPSGTTIWTAPPMNGAVNHIVQGAVTLDNRRQVYALEHGVGPDDVIRAFDLDGRSLWAMSVTGRVDQFAGDRFGGVVALAGSTIFQLTPDGNETTVAEDAGGFAINDRANVYFVNGGRLVGGGASVPLPQGEGAAGYSFGGIPTVLADGRVAVPVYVHNDSQTMDALQLMIATLGGGTETHTVVQVPKGDSLGSHVVTPYKAVPNGRGDIFVLWSDVGNHGQNLFAFANVSVVHADGSSEGGAVVGNTWGGFGGRPLGGIVFAEDQIVTTAYGLPNHYGNSAVVAQLSSSAFPLLYDFIPAPPNEVPKLPTFVAVVGGVVSSWPDGTMSGPDPAFDQMHLTHAQPTGESAYLGAALGGLSAIAGPPKQPNPTGWSSAQGSQNANRETKTCPSQDSDLNSLIAEYPGTKSPHISGPIFPKCPDFVTAGADNAPYNRHFTWGQLSGRTLRDNPHHWAIVKDSLSAGLDRTYEVYGGAGVRVTSVYRAPNVNAGPALRQQGSARSSAHMWGVGADIKPTNTVGDIDPAVWDNLVDLVAASPINAVWTEPLKQSTYSHVHVSFEWWPGRPEFRLVP